MTKLERFRAIFFSLNDSQSSIINDYEDDNDNDNDGLLSNVDENLPS